MKDLTITVQSSLPDETAVQFFAAWVGRLADDTLGLNQAGMSGLGVVETYSFGNPNGQYFELAVSGRSVTLKKIVRVTRDQLEPLLRQAAARVAANETDRVLPYQTAMTVRSLNVLSGMTQFMRTLGDLVPIYGSRRLSDVVVLDFSEDEASAPLDRLFAPDSTIDATVFIPCPGMSAFSQQVAAGITEVAAAVCALATGRPVDYVAPAFPIQDHADAAAALERRHDTEILTLARDGVSLDVFRELASLGSYDAVLRVRGSLLAYHAALKQDSPDVAVMLFVTSIEALIAPQQPWKKNKVTQRFIKALVELCPEAVDELLDHENVVAAFNFQPKGSKPRQRKDILDHIYQSRSLPTHAGLGLASIGTQAAMSSIDGIKLALLSDLARAAILSYLQAPRSSLVGHPMYEISQL